MTKIQKSVRFSTRARLMVGAGTVLPLMAFAVATPAQAQCTVDGDTTTCSGDVSGGVFTNTPNVVVEDLTADITPQAGVPAIWMPGVSNAQIDLGDHVLNVVGVPAIASLEPQGDVEVDFAGTINATGANTSQGGSSGININAAASGGANVVVNSTGNITVNASRDPAVSQWGNVGIAANGAAGGTAAITSTGDVSVTVAGTPSYIYGLNAAGSAGATVTNTGDILIAGPSGSGYGITASSEADSAVTSVGDIAVTLPGGFGVGISSLGANNTISSEGDITTTGTGIVGRGAVHFSNTGAFTLDVAESTSVTSVGDISTVANGAPAILALGDQVVVDSTGALSTQGDHSGGIVATANFSYDPAAQEPTYDVDASSVSVTSQGDITTAGYEAMGIAAAASKGDVSVVSDGDIATTGEGAMGILASGQNVAVESTGAIATEGDGAFGVAVVDIQMVNGDAEITGNGVSGDISVTGDSVTTTGAGAVGVRAYSSGGDVNVTMGSVATSGEMDANYNTSEGIYAESDSGTTTVAVGSASVEGYAASAAIALGGAGAHLTADEASSAGQYAAVLYAGSSNGDATVDAGVVTTRGDQQGGINAIADLGVATVNVDSIVNEGTLASGVFARGDTGASITAGSIEADEYGAVAYATGEGDASIVTTGDTTVTAGHGLRALGVNASISTAADTVTEAGTNALWGQADSAVTIDNQGTARTTGLGSAIFAESDGSVTITSANAEAVGPGVDPGAGPDGMRIAQGGIVANAAGPISIDADTVTVEGEFRYGISATSDAAISIVANTVDLESADSVAVVARGGTGDVSIATGTVTTTGASGVGVFGHTGSGAITIDAGTTRVENEGLQGPFTGDAVVATSGSGAISITSDNAFSGALYGSAVVGQSGGDVTIVSNLAETTGAGGAAVLGQSNAGTLTLDLASVVTSGDDSAAINAFAFNGTGNVAIGDIAATGANATGLTAIGRNMNVTVNGNVSTTGRSILVSAGVEGNTVINGSVTSSAAAAVVSASSNGVVEIAEGATVTGKNAGVALIGNQQGGFSQLYNSGTISASDGAAVFGGQSDPSFPVASVYIQNDGTISSELGLAVQTGGGDDVLELTENSVIEGYADLGDGWDHLVVDFNDEAPADAIGQVAATANVEMLSVDSGNWRAEGPTSFYDEVEIEDGTSLTIAQYEGYSSILANHVDLGGTLNLDFDTDTEAGDLTGLLIDGAGSVHVVGGATILVDDASGLQHTGGTFVENGTLLLTDVYDGDVATSGEGTFQLGDGGTTGDFTGDMLNDGTFVFSRSDDYSLLGAFSGNGLLVKNGDGTLSFDGTYDFTGTTTINAGAIALTGQLDADTELDLSGEGSFDLSQVAGGQQEVAQLSGTGGNLQLGTTSLTINQDSNTSFSGSISGSGTLTKQGTGDLKLGGDSSFSGTANVNGGTLSVNGSYAGGTFVVNEGGLLGGNGTVGDTTIQGGSLGAGNSIGVLTVAGDLTLTSASTLVVEVDPAGNADLIDVIGSAALGGATVNVLAGAGVYAPATDYTILTADGGISGTFGTVNTNLAYLVPLLSYTVDTVTLNLTRNDVDYSTYAKTANQAAIGNLIEALGYGSTLYDTTLVMARGDVADDFETLTGGVYPSFTGALVETADMLRRQTMQAPRSGSGAYGWATGLLGNVSGEGKAGVSGFKADNTGIAGGLGYAMAGFDVSAGLGYLSQDPGSRQVNDSKVTFATLQAAYSSPVGVKVRAGIQLGWFDAKSNRNTSLGTLSNSLSGALKGDYTQYYGEVAFAVPSIAFSIEPFAGISHVSLNVDKFTETGGATALTVNGLDRDVTFGDLGLRLSAPLPGGITPYGSVSYRRAWGDRASLASVAFAGNTASGVISGLPIAKDAAEVEAGLRYTAGMIELGLGYSGSFSKTFDSNTVRVSASFKF